MRLMNKYFHMVKNSTNSSDRCSPSQLIGPKRFRPVPMTVDKLPRVDAVIISHNHYDHLDYNSVRDLHEKFGKTGDGISWFVGAGLKSWFSSCGINKNVTELSWWQHGECKNIQFVFTIAQHWSARGLTDRCKVLFDQKKTSLCFILTLNYIFPVKDALG
jgi:N-acyl-phosphatidylethanolamine-hydrolysing phospholipase D